MAPLPQMSKKKHDLSSFPEESLTFALHWRELAPGHDTTLDDLSKWERKAVKAIKSGRSADVRFVSDTLTETAQERISERLALAETVDDVRHAFKAHLLTDVEQALADKIAAIFRRHGGHALRDIVAGVAVQFNQLDASLRAALLPAILEYALDQMALLAEEIGPSFDPAIVMTTASQWAQAYTFDLVKGLTDTTRQVVQNAVSAFNSTPGMTREALERLLRPAFGQVRAEMISITEVTRSAAAATLVYRDYLAENGLMFERINLTNADDRVCQTCSPLDGKAESEWPNDQGPPWHPRCRCAVSLRKVRA